MKSAVLVFPGINRERDMARALKLASGNEAAMVWHAETALPKGTDLVVVPGGFSYGDYLRCGAIAARAPVMDAVRDFAAGGGLVLADRLGDLEPFGQEVHECGVDVVDARADLLELCLCRVGHGGDSTGPRAIRTMADQPLDSCFGSAAHPGAPTPL
jgi:hypothetical protein